MIRKRAVWCTGSGADIADAGSLVTGLKHYLQAGVKDIFAKGRFGHEAKIRTSVLKVKKLFSPISPESERRFRIKRLYTARFSSQLSRNKLGVALAEAQSGSEFVP